MSEKTPAPAGGEEQRGRLWDEIQARERRERRFWWTVLALVFLGALVLAVL